MTKGNSSWTEPAKNSRVAPLSESCPVHQRPSCEEAKIPTQTVITENDVVENCGIISTLVTAEKASLSQTAGEYLG